MCFSLDFLAKVEGETELAEQKSDH